MADTITIEGKIPGQRRPLFPEFALPYPPAWQAAGNRTTLRALITQAVLGQVQAFQERQEANRLVRALSAQDIEAGLMKGKVEMGGREAVQEVVPAEAVQTALTAFEDGLFYVFVDDAQIETLDAELDIRPDSRVTFLRLVALAGG